MHKSRLSALLAGTVALSGCTTYGNDRMVAPGAAYGAAGGAALGAIVPGVSVAEGAVAAAAAGGLAGGVWADRNNDGYVDGYVQNGQYYAGTPQGYNPTLRRVASGAVGGAVLGAAVGGLAGAVWADNNGDGQTDGYVYNGQYYAGAPQGYQQPAPALAPTPVDTVPARGERG